MTDVDNNKRDVEDEAKRFGLSRKHAFVRDLYCKLSLQVLVTAFLCRKSASREQMLCGINDTFHLDFHVDCSQKSRDFQTPDIGNELPYSCYTLYAASRRGGDGRRH